MRSHLPLPVIATSSCCAVTGTLPPWVLDLREANLAYNSLQGPVPTPSAAQQGPLGQQKLELLYNQLTGCARTWLTRERVPA